MKSTYGTGCFAIAQHRYRSCGLQQSAFDHHRLPPEWGSSLRNWKVRSSCWRGCTTFARRTEMIGSARKPPSLRRSRSRPERLSGFRPYRPCAPWWDAEARGAMFGMTRNTGPAEFARAALESVCSRPGFAWRDAQGLPGNADTLLRVDGGMSANDWTMQHWPTFWAWR